jgi:hypothetical protein
MRPARHHRPHALILLALIGLSMLAFGAPLENGKTASPPFSDSATQIEYTPSTAAGGTGAVVVDTISSTRSISSTATAICFNPLDASCWLQNAAQWIAQQIMNALQPIIHAIVSSPLNILTQTPPADTYQNAMVITWWNGFLSVVDLAVACLIVIGGYNVIVGRHLGLGYSELAEFLPRLMLAVGAAHFSLYFLGLFIDLENALCSVALNLAGTSILTNIIAAIFQGNVLGEGLLVWMLAFVVGIMVILLGAQMAVRLALLWILLVLAGPGLACFALPQTLGYGRMWLSLTASTVLVQFFQVLTLALGSVLLTSLGASNIFHLDSTLATLLICIALLYLVLRLPGIVQRFALRPMMDASSSVTGAAGYVANVAPRLLALL